MDLVIVIMAVAFGTAADLSYYRELKKPGHAAPNRWSWLIWSFSSYVEVATFNEVSGDLVKVIPLATTPIACTLLLGYIWRLKEDRWETRLDALVDIASVVASISALIIWLCFREELWAHIVVILAVPVSYIPYWKSLPESVRDGEVNPWILWTLMDATNLLLCLRRIDSFAELPYVATELLCHASMWLLLSFRRSA